MLKSFLRNSTVLLSGMIICGFFAIHLGKELCWDLANYHYYIPFAFFHDRSLVDYWPTSYIHQFLNPTIDFLSYFLINSSSPLMVEFILGAIHGINFWLLFLIARVFLKNHFILPILLAILGLYGPMAMPSIGSFQNDLSVSIFVLTFVLLQLHILQNIQTTKRYLFFIPGLILGIGIGLKLTASVFAVGAFFALVLLPIPNGDKLKLTLIFSVTIIAGLLLSSGHWMFILWQKYHNPVFPFFNYYFRSPDFASVNWHDARFMPHTFVEAIFYPFYFSWDGRIADIPFRDFRFLIVYIFFLLAGLKWLWQTINTKKTRGDIVITWFFSFFIFSYIIWEYEFSIARYLIALELLSPLVIYLLVIYLVKNIYARIALLYLSYYFLVTFLVSVPVIRAPWFDSSFFNIKMPLVVSTTPNALVLTAYPAYVLDRDPRPQFYLIPYFPPGWRFIGIPFAHEKYLVDDKITDKIATLIKNNHDPIYLLTSNFSMPEFYRTAANVFKLSPAGNCQKIFSDRQAITNEDVLLCPVI